MPQSGDSSTRSRRSLRPKPRQATFVLPSTGQRLKGLVNLRNPYTRPNPGSNANPDQEHEERRGLLSGEISHNRDGILSKTRAKAAGGWLWTRRFLRSELGIGVLKCSLAYLLGSLATFIPAISSFLGNQDGKHVVATVTVYFHPARSQGSMCKALICALLAFCYAAFVSLMSMCITVFFQDSLHLLPLGHALVLIVSCGGGLGFIGWTKQRLGDPLVNVACSLASLSVITVLTKEGAVQSGDISFAKISQVLKMVIMGVSAAMAVSLLIFPISARKKLRANLTATTESLAVMLVTITEGFLSGSEEELQSDEFVNATARHKKAYSQLDALVKEAKLEHYVVGTEKEYRHEKNLVRQVQDITHNMGGLRSAAAVQFQLLKATKLAESIQLGSGSTEPSHVPPMSPWSFQEEESSFLDPMNERPEERESVKSRPNSAYTQHDLAASDHIVYHSDIFAVFIHHLGPSTRSLAFALTEIFREIPFGPAPNYHVSINSRFHSSLDRALELYKASRENALKSIYRQKEVMKIQSVELGADLEEVSASCGHFSSSLLSFGEELQELLAVLDELQLEAEERPNGRSWNWLKFWRRSTVETKEEDDLNTGMLNIPTVENKNEMLMRPLEEAFIGNHTDNRANPPSEQRNSRAPSPPSLENSPKERLGFRIWKSLGIFRRDDTKFAIKVGTGAALYALPSFISSTRPIYSLWRGEWGLLSYMLVCSMTIGTSNTSGYSRFFGSSFGAACALVAWYTTAGNVYGLVVFGLIMATSTSYLNIVRKQGPLSRYIMLTYNLSVLYAYSLTQKGAGSHEDEGGDNPIITDIVLHRVVAVLSGCIWGVVITRLIWPISARARLKNSLSVLWLRMSLIWKRDPMSTTMAMERKPVAYMTPREKLEIERFQSHMESLQAAARSEFELKSPFADSSYDNILRRTRSMVDAFHAMNLELVKNSGASEGEIAILQYTSSERKQLSSRISHLLSVLASSMKLEYPLIDVLPNIEHSRERLLARIFRYRQDKAASRASTDEDYALIYAYILVTGQLSTEIIEVIEEIGRLFGMLNEDAVKL